MNLNNNLKKSYLRIYLSTGFVGIFIISILYYGFSSGIRMITKWTPLIDANMEIKIELTTAHLWIEEILSGDVDESIEIVWKHIEQADWFSQAMLEGGEGHEITILPIKDEGMRQDVARIRQKLVEFIRLTNERMDNQNISGVGTKIDQRYDMFFVDLLNDINQTESKVKHLINKDLKQFRITEIILIAVSVFLFLLVGYILGKYEQRHQTNLLKIKGINESIENEIEISKQAEKKIQKSEKFNRAITETAVDAIITINSHGDVLSWNSAATKIFGYTSAEMKNKNLSKILPEQYESGHNKGVERLKGGGRKKLIGKTIEIAAKKKDGTEFPVELSLSSWEVDNQVNYTGVIRDISRRKNFELQQSVIYQISEATQNAKDLDMLYKSIHKILGQVLDVTNFYIAQYDEKEKLLSFPFDIDSEDEFPTTARPLGNGITEYMIKTGKPLLLTKNDINEYNRKGKFEAVGALSEQWMGAPLKIKNKVVGVIAVNSYNDPNLYTKSDLKFLTFVAEQVALAIQQKQSITELEVEKTYLDELFTSSPEALALVTIDGTVLHVNDQFTTLFGFKEEDIFGRNIDDLLVSRHHKKIADEYTKKVAVGKRVYFEAVRNTKDGSPINVSVLSSPVNYKGDVLAVYAAYRDITDRVKATEIIKESEEKYRTQSIELSESNTMKEMLLDVIAHDLKNPAGVIKGFAEFGLEMDPKNEILKEIEGGVDNLLNVIGYATTLSKVALGDKINKEELDLVKIIKIAVDENASQIELNEMTLDMEMDESLKVHANPIICEVFRNYITNAIKYAKAGGKIIIDTVVDDEFVTVNVKDHGETIKLEDRENIFIRNLQLRKTKGRGLGLAIVKRIAKAHSAEVGVLPNTPRGNIFYLKLPMIVK